MRRLKLLVAIPEAKYFMAQFHDPAEETIRGNNQFINDIHK